MEPLAQVQIHLTMLLVRRSDRVDMICLETNVAVSANTDSEASEKMRDASLLYLSSFSSEEIVAGSYKRLAPLKYRVLGLLTNVVHNWRNMTRSNADYDQTSNSVRFA